MLSTDKLAISKARPLYGLNGRELYKYEWDTGSYHTFFEDTYAVERFPIVLVGGWSDREISTIVHPIVDTLAKDHCIFIVAESGYRYTQYSFRKIPDSELPLVYTDDAHSTTSIIWEHVWIPKTIESPRIVDELSKQLSNYMKQG